MFKKLSRRIYRMFNPRKRYYNHKKVTFKDIDNIYRELYIAREDIYSLAKSLKKQKVQGGVYMDEKDAKKYMNNGSSN